ncbi:aliphatic sulfonate ABC transporter substrate-binding protein [Pectobacterium versatile]|nr:aliphatic sulfonate ABC transporter substrate-binding protein [Pectobacterium versatile]
MSLMMKQSVTEGRGESASLWNNVTARLRQLPAILAAGAVLLMSTAYAQDSVPTQLRVGYQKGSVSLVLAKSHQLLEKQFPNTKISWVEFPAGPQMLEALNVGSIDLGGTGDIPPIFAQAAGADLLYVGVEPPKPQAEVILVREDSPVKNVADLKGRKVAFQKGSSAHNTLLRALQREGLKFTDIKPTYLTPADARAAFQQGNVDAWAIWDPYYSAALQEGGVRVLIDSSGLEKTGSFYLAGRPYAEAHGTFIRQALDVLTKADALTISDRAQSVTLLANAVGLPEKVIETALDHRPPTTVEPLDAATIKAQQSTADLFYENRLVPVKVNIAERVWRPQAN